MTQDKSRWIAAGIGFAVWLLVALAGGRAEAWDSPLYWSLGQPLLLIAGAALGWGRPGNAWHFGLWLAGGQFVAMMIIGIIHGSGFGLLPLGIIALLVLSLPAILAAAIAGRFRKWRGQRDKSV